MKKLNEMENNTGITSFLDDKRAQNIIQILDEALEPGSVILFGSFAKGSQRNDSDLDLAYIPQKTRPGPYERFQMASTLADIAGREVDLIDFEQASPVFRVQIIDSGVLLQDKNPSLRQALFMRSLKEYAMLNEERGQILQNRMQGGFK